VDGRHPLAAQFQPIFAGVVANLAIPDLNAFHRCGNAAHCPLASFNSAESRHSPANSNQGELENELNIYLANDDLAKAIAQALPGGSPLTLAAIVNRAQVLSCAGCHELSNNAEVAPGVRWPPSLGHVHVTEREIDNRVPSGRYRISRTLHELLLPHRAAVL